MYFFSAQNTINWQKHALYPPDETNSENIRQVSPRVPLNTSLYYIRVSLTHTEVFGGTPGAT